MSKVIVGVCLLILLSTVVGVAAPEKGYGHKTLHVCVGGNVDADLAAAVAERVQSVYKIGTSVSNGRREQSKTRPTLALVAIDGEEVSLEWKSHEFCELNVVALGDPDDVGEEVYRRRVLREAVRAVGGLLAMPECPMKTCALSEHKTLKELDEKGRGLCPPCMVRAAKHVHMLKLKRAEPEKKAVKAVEKPTPLPSREGSGDD